MKKTVVLLTLVVFVLSLALLAGCGQKTESTDADQGETQVATHDCEGDCGMKAMAADQVTEIDGKYYCAGCAAKVQEGDHADHDHSGGDHSGHDHN